MTLTSAIKVTATPKDLKIDQRKSLLSGPGVHTNRKTLQKTHSLHHDKTLSRTGLAGQSMAAEAGTDHDLGEEVTTAKYRESGSRKGSDMGAADEIEQKSDNKEKKGGNGSPPTESGINGGDKLNRSEANPVPPFERLTRGDHHTSSGRFWAFTGVQFPGSRETLATLIPTLRLPISEENIARQISDKANYVQVKHNIKGMFILTLESSITTSMRYTNSDNKHSPLQVFRDLADHPPVYFQAAPGLAKEFATQKEIAIIRGFSSSPGIIESTIAALQLTLNIRAPRAQIAIIVTPLKTYFKPRNKPSPRHTTDKRWTMSSTKCAQETSHRRCHSTLRAHQYSRQCTHSCQRLPLPTQQPTGRDSWARIPTADCDEPHPLSHTVSKHM